MCSSLPPAQRRHNAGSEESELCQRGETSIRVVKDYCRCEPLGVCLGNIGCYHVFRGYVIAGRSTQPRVFRLELFQSSLWCPS